MRRSTWLLLPASLLAGAILLLARPPGESPPHDSPPDPEEATWPARSRTVSTTGTGPGNDVLPAPAEAPTLRGTVRDEEGDPVADAEVTADPQPGARRVVFTGRDGSFDFGGVPPLPFVLRIRAGGLLPSRPEWVDVAPAKALRPVLLHGESIRGWVVDADGVPMDRVSLVAGPMEPASDEEPVLQAASTGADGRFAIRGLRPGPHRIDVLRAGSRFPTPLPAEAGTGDLVVRALRTTRVAGRIVGPEGRPVDGASVFVGHAAGPGVLVPRSGVRDSGGVVCAFSGQDGAFEAEGLVGEEFDLEAFTQTLVARPLRGVRAGSGDLLFEMASPLRITGSIRPVQAAMEELDVLLADAVGTIRGVVRKDGTFEFDLLPPGRYGLALRSGGRTLIERPGVAAGTEDLRLDLPADR